MAPHRKFKRRSEPQPLGGCDHTSILFIIKINKMKTLLPLSLLTFIFLFSSTPQWAQNRDTITLNRKGKKIQIQVMEESENDTVPEKKITLGIEDSDEKEKSFDPWKTRWLMFDFGFASYIYNDGSPSEIFPEIEGAINPMEQEVWGSWNFNIHLFKTRLSLHKNYISLMSGLSFEYFQYDLENEVSMRPRDPNVVFDFTGTDYDVNRLSAWYMTVPLTVNFESNPENTKRSFRVGAGGFVGLRRNTQYREKFDIFDNRTNNNFNFNQFRYGVNAEIGYGWITLYGNLALNDFFDADNNDVYDMMPLNVGIRLIGF